MSVKDDSKDAATLDKSLVADSNDELDKRSGASGESVSISSLSFKSRSTEAEKPEVDKAKLSVVVDETGEENEDDEPLKPCM